MKRLISFIIMLFMLCGCSGTMSSQLQKAMDIPENGIIEQQLINQIKDEKAVCVFKGNSNDYAYEWTIFGSDITETADINLNVSVDKVSDNEISLAFEQQQDFGFPMLLSVHLKEKWNCNSAVAYVGEQAVYSVSLTGSDHTILNIPINKITEECIVRMDISKETTTPEVQTTVQKTESTEEILKSDTTKADIKNQTDDAYLSAVKKSDNRVYSDGRSKGKDRYMTDTVPAGKPMPVEPQEQKVDKETSYNCTISIECTSILNNLDDLESEKLEMVPSDGEILSEITVEFYEGESVFDILQRTCRKNDIHMESSWTPIYNSAYVEGIGNLYEFDCGSLSGWMYSVNGWYPNYGCSRYIPEDGDVIEWRYTCDLGKDIGGSNAIG